MENNIDKYNDLSLLRDEIKIISSDELNYAVSKGRYVDCIYASTSDSGIEKAAELSERQEYLKFIKTCRDKLKLQKLLYGSNFFSRVLTHASLSELDDKKKYVIKPNKGTGSMDISMGIGNSLKNRFIEIADAKKDFIIEEYIEGIEYSAEYMIHEGKIFLMAIFRKYNHSHNMQQEIMHELIEYNERIDNELSAEIEKILKCTNAYTINTFLHIEFKLKEDSIHVIEINPRLCGSLLPFALKYMYNGLDFDRLFVEVITNKVNPNQLAQINDYKNKSRLDKIIICSTTSPERSLEMIDYFKDNSIVIEMHRVNENFISNCSDFRGRHSTFMVHGNLNLSVMKKILDVADE